MKCTSALPHYISHIAFIFTTLITHHLVDSFFSRIQMKHLDFYFRIQHKVIS